MGASLDQKIQEVIDRLESEGYVGLADDVNDVKFHLNCFQNASKNCTHDYYRKLKTYTRDNGQEVMVFHCRSCGETFEAEPIKDTT